MQARQVDGSGDALRVGGAGLHQASGGTGHHAAACGRADDHRGILAVLLSALHRDLVAEGLDAGDAVGRVQGRVEVTGVFQDGQEGVEQFGTDGQLNDFSAVGFALSGLLDDLGLADAVGVEAFLHDDALQALHGGLGCDGCAVVAGSGGHNALVAHLLGGRDCAGSSSGLEGTGGVGGFILCQDGGAVTGLGVLSGQRGQVSEFEDRRVADAGQGLHSFDLFEGVAGGGHQSFVVEAHLAGFELVIVEAHGLFHDLVVSSHYGSVVFSQCHYSSPPNRISLSWRSIWMSSGTNLP